MLFKNKKTQYYAMLAFVYQIINELCVLNIGLYQNHCFLNVCLATHSMFMKSYKSWPGEQEKAIKVMMFTFRYVNFIADVNIKLHCHGVWCTEGIMTNEYVLNTLL